MMSSPDVAIVGAGPAGLSAAAELAGVHRRDVMVIEREKTAGGIPRHSDHLGFGVRDMHTFVSGPTYAKRLVRQAVSAGARILTQAMVTAVGPDNSLEVTSPGGLLHISPRALILATGARERPRTARLVPGDRSAGVFTTGHLQNVVHLHHGEVGKRAVVVGAELVSWSAVMTLRHAGVHTVLMTTRYASPESYAALNFGGRAIFRVPVATRTRVSAIIGKPRVRSVEIEDLDTRARRLIDCDTVVFTGDWIPDHELAQSAGIELDPATKGPLVDLSLRTRRPGVFAAGNVLHPVDTADIAALDGIFVAAAVDRYLTGDLTEGAGGVRIRPGGALRWISPGLLGSGASAPPRGRLLAWTDEQVRVPKVTVTQSGRVTVSKRLPWPATPGRVFRIPSSVLRGVDPNGGDVVVDIANARSGDST